ncbi:hypothetical protein [Jiella mangrovi]|uniref:GAF domain-containing protein n=1 Tax=Jiella mangrovi TaxID=2821407 RepID=A0ABS4BJ43_9HYPH|nr:hypothetical protein [Jiella mangrovi]MBP0616794.1 hypothetical protein [Jiella mangrovi]
MSCDPAHLSALVAGPEAAARVFAYAQAGVNAAVGRGLMTASIFDIEKMRSRRVFSEDPGAYPIGNFKRVDPNGWYDRVIRGRAHFAATTIEEIASAFFDWEKIRDLGFGSSMNLPAIADDRVIGTMNLLGPRGMFDATNVARVLAWQPVVTTAFLLLNLRDRETATLHEGLSVANPLGGEGLPPPT